MDITAYFKPSAPPPPPSPKPITPSRLRNNHKQPPNPPPPRDHPSQPPPPPPPLAPTHPLPPQLTIQPLTQPHLHPFRRLTSLLLPIPYPDKFYTDTLTDPTISSLTRVATWHDLPHPPPGKRKRPHETTSTAPSTPSQDTTVVVVVGAIRCRLEDLPATSAGAKAEKTLYVQTLCLLSPYRGMGIGTALLEAVVRVAVRRYGVVAVYAHVWEANAEALEWYRKRGFEVGELEVGYYRRLKPAGARVVRRRVGVGEYLAAGVGGEGRIGGEGEGEGDGGEGGGKGVEMRG